MKKQVQKSEPILLVDGNRGIYMGRYLYNQYREYFVVDENGIPNWVMTDIQDTENEYYLEAWEWIEQNVQIELDGQRYTLYQDDSLWAIPEGYSWEDDFEE
jgi:hypothetical protein